MQLYHHLLPLGLVLLAPSSATTISVSFETTGPYLIRDVTFGVMPLVCRAPRNGVHCYRELVEIIDQIIENKDYDYDVAALLWQFGYRESADPLKQCLSHNLHFFRRSIYMSDEVFKTVFLFNRESRERDIYCRYSLVPLLRRLKNDVLKATRCQVQLWYELVFAGNVGKDLFSQVGIVKRVLVLRPRSGGVVNADSWMLPERLAQQVLNTEMTRITEPEVRRKRKRNDDQEDDTLIPLTPTEKSQVGTSFSEFGLEHTEFDSIVRNY